MATLARAECRTALERYKAAYDLIAESDESIEAAFDNPRRSTAYHQLVNLRALKSLTEEETRAILLAVSDED